MLKKILIILSLIYLSLQLNSKISNDVYKYLIKNNKITADVLILLNEQADFSNKQQFLEHLSWEERGRYVLDTVMELAKNTQKSLISILEKNKINYRSYYIANFIAADQVPLSILEEISQKESVQLIHTNQIVDIDLEKPDPIQPIGLYDFTEDDVEFNVKFINATYIWEKGFNGEGVTVANCDTGVEYTHPALVSNYRGNLGNGKFSHDYNWFDPTSAKSKVPVDQNSHGTHTCGTTAGGVARKIGVAPGAKWIACRSIGSGTTAETFLACHQFFLAPHDLNGKNPNPDLRPVSSGHSYGCRQGKEPCKHEAWKIAIKNLRAAGEMIVASAGNAGSRCRTVTGPPGTFDTVFTVGALSKGTGSGSHTITSFSSRGPSQEENTRRPDISASGEQVTSSLPGGRYGAYSGTSMSCPAVNGAVTLFWSALPQLKGKLELTQKIFQDTAYHQKDGSCDTSVTFPNNVYGYGTINLGLAYEYGKEMIKKLNL